MLTVLREESDVAVRWAFAVVWILTASLAPACAGVDFQPATERDTSGIRYYLPATYWLVTPDYEKGQAKVTLFHGPDISKPFAANPYAVLSSNTSKLEFENGILKAVDSDAKSASMVVHTIQAATVVGKELLEAAAQKAALAASAARLGAGTSPATSGNAIFLFVDDGSGMKQLYPRE